MAGGVAAFPITDGADKPARSPAKGTPMPEFYPEHIPETADPFLKGYLAAFEWLLPDEQDGDRPDAIDRSKIRGWSREALRRIKADCRDFQRANKAALARYCELRRAETAHRLRVRQYDELECAGHDFFLTRERHGTGFWDRGEDPVFEELTKAAETYGEAGHPWLHRGWLRLD